ncbi:MAG: hypothetical protein WD712_00800 [Candidatus Spechtbacterales bacterium]
MKIGFKLKAWHLMPLSLLALLGLAVFVWMERGDFSTRNVSLHIEGPSQIENGKTEKFHIVVKNNSPEELEEINLSFDVPESLKISGSRDALDEGFGNVPPGQEQSIEFSLTASSIKNTEIINARVDYSPRGVSARFVTTASLEVVIGSFDASISLDMPKKVYKGQEVEGTINLTANSDIEISPIFLKLNVPEGFNITYRSTDFYYDTVWQLGSLKSGQTIKREFRGTLLPKTENPVFGVQLGILNGVRFIPLNSAEATVEITDVPIILEHRLLSPPNGEIKAGTRVEMGIFYINKSEFLVKDAIIKTSLPKGLIDFSTLYTNGDYNAAESVIEWNVANTPDLKFVDIDESGGVFVSFNVAEGLISKSESDKNKNIFMETFFDSIVLDGKVLQARESVSLKISTDLELEQDVYRGGKFSQQGPHPPQAGTLSTYTVRWIVKNTINPARSLKIEAALPAYASWMGESSATNGEIRYVPSTNTVVWTLDTAANGLGYIYPAEQIEFSIGVEPTPANAKGANTVLLLQTKLTGIDTYTGLFLEQNIGETTVSN